MDAIANFLFPVITDEERVQACAPANDALPFKTDEHAYYVNRLSSRMEDAHRAKSIKKERHYRSSEDHDFSPWDFDDMPEFRTYLRKLQLSTLVMIDEHRTFSNVTEDELRFMDEDSLRSALCISAISGKDHYLQPLGKAAKVMREYHGVPEDLTVLNEQHVRAVTAACEFLVSSAMYECCPPRLTDFIMRHPDRVEDVLSYVSVHEITRVNIHNIDVSSLSRFIENPSQSLREGAL